MTQHVMADLETLDTRPTAIILSIGACRMDHESGEILDPFYRSVQIASCRDAGLTCSESTLKWWADQSPEARAVLSDPEAVPLIQALADFSTYLHCTPGGQSKVKLWGCGSDFDNVILANAYQALGLDAPWRFYNNRCYRTVRSVLNTSVMEFPRAGVYHNALDDAQHQARVLLSMREKIQWR